MTVWDVGANVGAISLILARLVGRTGHVLAIEPSPRNAKALRRHVRKRATVIEAAVSSRSGWVPFAGDGRSDGQISANGSVLVKAITLDELLAVVPQPPALVKMDIEGHELDAFRGAVELLHGVRPMLVVEFHGAGLPRRDVDAETRAIVSQAGYAWEPTQGGWHVATPK
jgi:FkbM family methyltransferase